MRPDNSSNFVRVSAHCEINGRSSAAHRPTDRPLISCSPGHPSKTRVNRRDSAWIVGEEWASLGRRTGYVCSVVYLLNAQRPVGSLAAAIRHRRHNRIKVRLLCPPTVLALPTHPFAPSLPANRPRRPCLLPTTPTRRPSPLLMHRLDAPAQTLASGALGGTVAVETRAGSGMGTMHGAVGRSGCGGEIGESNGDHVWRIRGSRCGERHGKGTR